MYGIFTHIWLIFMVNVGKYTIHGSYGLGVAGFPAGVFIPIFHYLCSRCLFSLADIFLWYINVGSGGYPVKPVFEKVLGLPSRLHRLQIVVPLSLQFAVFGGIVAMSHGLIPKHLVRKSFENDPTFHT